jgi:hypothetical protein
MRGWNEAGLTESRVRLDDDDATGALADLGQVPTNSRKLNISPSQGRLCADALHRRVSTGPGPLPSLENLGS